MIRKLVIDLLLLVLLANGQFMSSHSRSFSSFSTSGGTADGDSKIILTPHGMSQDDEENRIVIPGSF